MQDDGHGAASGRATNPTLGGAGASAGLLNQVIELDLAGLHDGDNTVELLSSGTWTGTYRVTVRGVDLVLDDW